MQYAERAAVEPYDADCDILGLDPLVSQDGGAPENLNRLTQHGYEQVDGVHTLVHQGATTLESPGATPACCVVVTLVPPPVD